MYALRPEVPGQLGDDTQMDYSTTPYRPTVLHVEFEGWAGDDLCRVAGNVYFVTERLKDGITRTGLTGYDFAPMTVTRSEVFVELEGDVELPRFWWFKVTGNVGLDDFAIGPVADGGATLIVTDEALACLRQFSLNQCEVTPLHSAA